MLEDVSDEYAAAARRYFGDDQGKAWVEQLSGQPMVRFHLRLAESPHWLCWRAGGLLEHVVAAVRVD
jgi:hypothetical protein